MGDVEINNYFRQHVLLGTTDYEYSWYRHRGTPAVSSTSPTWNQDTHDDMLDNCGTIADFRDQMPTALKAWWDALPLGERNARYAAFKVMAGK